VLHHGQLVQPGRNLRSSCSGAVDSNYTISYVNGSVLVNKAPLSIAASSDSMIYGGTAPSITARTRGFVNGDTAASLTTPRRARLRPARRARQGLPHLVLGRHELQLRHHLRERVGPGQPGAAVRRGIVGLDDLRRLGPTITASYSGFVNGDTAGS